MRKASNSFSSVSSASVGSVGSSGSSSRSSSDAVASSLPRLIHYDNDDDADGNYIVRKGDIVHDRYVVLSCLGAGSFGKVVRAYDQCAQSYVALKVVRNRKEFYDQAQLEIRIMRMLNEAAAATTAASADDEQQHHYIVRMLDAFYTRDHQFMVFELLSYNLFELIRHTRYTGVSLNLVRKFARQILHCLCFLADGGAGGGGNLKVVHCDLKPENVLLCSPVSSAVRVIDFGSSCVQTRDEQARTVIGTAYTYVQSRFYRSPEVLLGCAYSTQADMWSLACILSELHTGMPLFDGHSEPEQVEKIVSMRGMPPAAMVRDGSKASRFFEITAGGGEVTTRRCTAAAATATQCEFECAPRRRSSTLLDVMELSARRRRGEAGHSAHDYALFVDLLERILAWEPRERPTPSECLAHPFLAATAQRQASGRRAGGASRPVIDLDRHD